MIRFAKKEDRLQVIALWQEAFSDTKAEIEEFFCSCKDLARICVWEEAGEIAAQLILLPVTLVREGGKGSYPTEYIYAVATKQTWKGQGIATKLLQEVTALLAAEQKAGILVPAKESLTKFYEKRGFKKCFLEEKITTTPLSTDNVTMDVTEVSYTTETAFLQEIDAGVYQELRRKAFCDCMFVDLPLQMLSYAMKNWQDAGGKCVSFTYKEKSFGVWYRQKGAIIEIAEITAPTMEEVMEVAEIFVKLFAAEGAETLQIRRSYPTLGVHLPKEILPKEENENGIFNFVLD